jgi:hypothetical protein
MDEIESTMERPNDSECLVKIFKDSSYRVAKVSELKEFDPNKEPFLSYATSTPGYFKDEAVAGALRFHETGSLPKFFKWPYYGKGTRKDGGVIFADRAASAAYETDEDVDKPVRDVEFTSSSKTQSPSRHDGRTLDDSSSHDFGSGTRKRRGSESIITDRETKKHHVMHATTAAVSSSDTSPRKRGRPPKIASATAPAVAAPSSSLSTLQKKADHSRNHSPHAYDAVGVKTRRRASLARDHGASDLEDTRSKGAGDVDSAVDDPVQGEHGVRFC